MNTSNLNNATQEIAQAIETKQTLVFGTRESLAKWLEGHNLYDDVYNVIDNLNSAGRHHINRKHHRLPTEPLTPEQQFMIVDQRPNGPEDIENKPIWSAVPLAKGLRLQTFEGEVRTRQRHELKARRAADILDANKTDQANVSPEMIAVAQIDYRQSNLRARASKKISDALAPALDRGELEPLISITNVHADTFNRLLNKLDKIETEDGDFTV